MTKVRAKRNAVASRVRILDTTEQLFAAHGFDGVPTRAISSEAGIALGLLTYHFATKDILLEAVIARRADTLKAAQRAALAEMPANYALEDIFHAFTRPILEFMCSGDPGWRAYGQLIAVLAQQKRWTPLLQAYFGDISMELIEHILTAEPRLDRDVAIRAFDSFISVLMGAFAITGALDAMSNGRMTSDDLRSTYPTMMLFVVGGFRALIPQ